MTNLGDMTRSDFAADLKSYSPDVLIASTPCQAFSTIGKRRSLGDDRGNLTLALVNIFHTVFPKWLVWENVPGVLSTADNAFGHLLGGLLGMTGPLEAGSRTWPDVGIVRRGDISIAWRIIDSQGFVAQRRRRLVLVASTGGRDPSSVLLETKEDDIFPGIPVEWLRKHSERSRTLAFDWQASGAGNDKSFMGKSRRWVVRPRGTSGTLGTTRTDAVLQNGVVRKLSSAESLRLMGFDGDYLTKNASGKTLTKKELMRMVGNSVVTHMFKWVFFRIAAAEEDRVR
ncbi:site-specific DNA-cytosine methylase [Rhizobium sp. BK176]|nr:site-specific DNA-cytosine methylase [Rhizobium sp. BK176]